MGGGAGIKFTIEPEAFYATVSQRGVVRPVDLPTITKFSAIGYDDGMRDVKGELLRVTAVVFDKVEPEYVKRMRQDGWRLGEHHYVSLSSWRDWPCTMIWAGYARGNWKQAFPMSFEHTLDLEGYDSIKATFVVKPAKEFGSWWADVFDVEYEPDEEDKAVCQGDERCLSEAEQAWWQLYWDDVRTNWGTK